MNFVNIALELQNHKINLWAYTGMHFILYLILYDGSLRNYSILPVARLVNMMHLYSLGSFLCYSCCKSIMTLLIHFSVQSSTI